MRSARYRARAGFTLAEMLVVILILGLTAGVTVFSIGALKPPPQSDLARVLRESRAEAIRQGHAVEVLADSTERSGGRNLIRFLPDGRAIGPGVDPWTGVPTIGAPVRPK